MDLKKDAQSLLLFKKETEAGDSKKVKLISDKTGFPMAAVYGLGAFHLWPVCKVQFEQFMSETDKYGDEWYNKILSLNGRISHDTITEDNYEHIFMTGVLPREARAFANWLGDEFDLPTEAEWKRFYSVMQHEYFIQLSTYGLSAPAAAIVEKIADFRKTPSGFSFLKDGVVEWVREDKSSEYVGRGTPRTAFLPNTWNPETHSVRAIDKTERIFYFGFRLIRRGRRAPTP